MLEGLDDEVVVPAMVRFELLAGTLPTERAAVVRFLDLCLDAPIDAAVADVAADLSRRYSKSHSGIDAIDYVVAATAQLLDARLLTRNIKHFPMFRRLRSPY